MHNGVILSSKAIEAVDFLYKNSKKIVFLSNAPRPSSKVINFLLKMNMDKKYLSNVMTSGEAAMHAINENNFGKTFFHASRLAFCSRLDTPLPPNGDCFWAGMVLW